METFEENLCTTVDAILELLGEKPKVTREQFKEVQRPHRIDLLSQHSAGQPQHAILDQTQQPSRTTHHPLAGAHSQHVAPRTYTPAAFKLVQSKSELERVLEQHQL